MWQEKFHVILMKIFNRFFGVFAVIFSVIILLSLFSFNASDVSFNTSSTSGEIKNWMGAFGSHISDLLFQLIGLSAFFLCLILFSLGIKMASKTGVRYLALKLILIPFCLLSFAVFFAVMHEPDWWIFNSLGGINGKFVLSKIKFIPRKLTFILSFLSSLILLSVIIEISLRDWKYFFRYCLVTSQYLYRIFTALSKKYGIVILRQIQILLGKLSEKLGKKSIFLDERTIVKNDKNSEEIEEDLEEEEEVEEVVLPKKPAAQKISKTKQMIKSMNNYGDYVLPSPELLTDRSGENKGNKVSKVQLEQYSKMLLKVLEDFSIYGNVLAAKMGPVVTLHEFEPAAGIKSSRVVGLADDISRSMSALSARIAPIPGKTTIGIELPNQKREMIYLRELIESKEYQFDQASLPIILGKDITGEAIITDLAKMPHLLIAGTTGSGKSVGVNAMILSLLYKLRPDECKFIMIDPKMLELSIYDGIPHLLAPVVTEPGRAVVALKWVVHEMEERYRLMSSLNVRNIAGYNEKIYKAIKNKEILTRKVQTGFDPESGEPIIEEMELEAKKLPFIVVIVDEMADLMLVAGKEIEGSVQRLAQMARAAGIHLVMATQRPSVDVITGVIKANFPTRISFQVTSRIDSRTILGVQGAEQLLGRGDMIYMSGGSKMTRVHGPFCSDTEVENVVNFIKSQNSSEDGGYGQNIVFEQIEAMENKSNIVGALGGDSDSDGDLYSKAVAIVLRDKKPSISYVQRQLRIGYNRAATLIERMEKEGVITPPNISGKREIINNS